MLVVSDANVIIDMEVGGLLDEFFRLPIVIAIPDILYAEEIEPYMPDLPDDSLSVRSLSAETVAYIDELGNRGATLPSSNDQIALGLARQEGCTLLTGDQKLRRLAAAEGVEVHGTIWVVEQMIAAEFIDYAAAENAFDRMRSEGSRLPQPEIEELLNRNRD